MNGYTPNTGDVRAAYGAARDSWGNTPGQEADAEFDRWLAQERAKAWDEGFDYAEHNYYDKNPYRKDTAL